MLPASELPAPALVVRGLVPPEVLPRRRPVQGSSVYSDTNMIKIIHRQDSLLCHSKTTFL